MVGAIGAVFLLWALFDWYPPPSLAFEDPHDVEVAEHALSEDFRWFEEHPDWKFSDRSDKDASVLHWLLVHHDISDEMITQLVKFGSDPYQKSQEQYRLASGYAIGSDRLDWVKAMVAGGMDINKVTEVGYYETPLFIAVILRKLEIVKYLINNGADVNLRNNFGATAIFRINPGNFAALNYLLDNGADVNVIDKGGGDICIVFSFVPSPETYKESFDLYVSALRKVTNKGVDCYSGRRIVNREYLTEDILKSAGLPLESN